MPGLDEVPRLKTGGPSLSAVGDDYFATVGTPILRGRAFGPEDRAGSEAVAIVSDTMARTVWPSADPIGKCLFVGKDAAACARIVGIAGDTRRSQLREPPVMHYYIPIGQEVGFGGTVLLARSTGANPALGPAIKRALVEYDASVRFVSLTTIQEAVDPQVKPWRIGAMVFSLSGLLALVVAAIGIYSVMSYLVADRTHEIGVRLALGAQRGDVARLILRGSLGMAAIGVAAGSIVALAASRFVAPLLFDESPRDPVVYGVVAGVLLLVAVAAGIVPTSSREPDRSARGVTRRVTSGRYDRYDRYVSCEEPHFSQPLSLKEYWPAPARSSDLSYQTYRSYLSYTSRPCLSQSEAVSDHTKSCLSSALAAWAKSIAPVTASSGATSR